MTDKEPEKVKKKKWNYLDSKAKQEEIRKRNNERVKQDYKLTKERTA